MVTQILGFILMCLALTRLRLCFVELGKKGQDAFRHQQLQGMLRLLLPHVCDGECHGNETNNDKDDKQGG